MTDLITLIESASTPVKKSGRWYVTVARPGQGSKGYYSEEVLKATGPKALPAGTKSYFKHAKTEERDPRDQVGVFEEGAFWNEEDGELGAFLTPFPRYASVLDEMYDPETKTSQVEASIRVAARDDGRGRVKELVYQRDNTVDLVAFAGLEGSGLKYKVESLFAAAAAEGEYVEEEENNVEITKEMWESLTTTIAGLNTKFDTFVEESLAERQGVADKAVVDAEVKTLVEEALAAYAETEAAIDAADIPKVVKESLKDAARRGEDITDTLQGAVSIVEETKKEFAPKTVRRGTVVMTEESLTGDTSKSFKVGRWNGAK